ncbi:Rtf2 RING-finger-domain-containing protein [Kockiozyma suomiensis]|uniref:Rtf2 RING-finger-domain-containing protein n=1 Tax=Kockiozyma suomiensis TaxID=1337062 RepID=UPI0033442E11
MGNDGGSIPTRRELVNLSSREATSSQVFEKNQLTAEFLWKTCRLSLKPLDLPIVSDYLGRLYNKDAILEWLISPESFGDGEALVSHIKTLKDVVELKISKDEAGSKWICPITGKEMKAGGSKFVYHAECGHVFAESALKEIEEDSCLECGETTTKDNLIIINPLLETDIELLQKRIEKLQAEGLTHSLKSASSKKKRRHNADEQKTKSKKNHKEEKRINGDIADATQRVLESVQQSKKQVDAVKV